MTTGNYEKLLSNVLGKWAEDAAELYPVSSDREARQNINRVLSAAWFAYSHHDWSRRLTEQGKPAYLYYFTKQNGGIGDWHSGEMIYAYGNLKNAPRNYTEEDFVLSSLMQQYWLNFVRTGDPNGEGLPEWPTFAEAETKALHFDSKVEMVEDPYLPLDELLDVYQDSLRDPQA